MTRPDPRRLAPAAALAVALALAAAGCHDRVLFTNPHTSGDIGILLDGDVDGAATNDRAYTTTFDGHVDPGDVVAGGHNEVIGYHNRRPPTLVENAAWTAGDDDVTVAFPGQMSPGFRVWLLEPPFADRQAQAIAACVRLDQIWRDERVGTRVGSFTMSDETANPAAAPYLDFTCAEAAAMRADIGHVAGRVNVYYVDRVNFGNGFATTNGVWCGNDTIAMGRNASDHLAVHEVGHGFALAHTNGIPAHFDTTNVMHNASNDREFLTEGQSFRAHLNAGSVINLTYNLRPGLPTRACGGTSLVATDTCPAVQKRIWGDGAGFPPN